MSCNCKNTAHEVGCPEAAGSYARFIVRPDTFLAEVERRAGESRDSMLQLCEHQRLIGHPRDGDELRRLLVRILGEERS